MDWLLLTYKLASEPSRRRVYIWRKLKRLGAISIFEAVWALPETRRAHEQFQWLAAEIQEMGGEAMFWKAQSEISGQDETLVNLFTRLVETAYQDLLSRLNQPNPDLAALAQEYQQVQQRDYFQCETGRQIYEILMAARGDAG